MKEIKNLTIKSSCFGEIDYATITPDMNQKVLPLLMFLVHKRNVDLKTRG